MLWLRLGRRSAALVLGLILSGCQGAVPGETGSPPSAGPSVPPPSFLQGGVSVGGAGGSDISDGPHTPRDRGARTYNPGAPLGIDGIDSRIADLLDQEQYSVTLGEHGRFGSDDPGDATLASFKQLSDWGIAIVDSEPADQGLPVEYYCDPMKAIAAMENSYPSDLSDGYLILEAEPGVVGCESHLNEDAGQWKQLLTTALSNQTLVDIPEALDPGPIVWAIAVTPKGLVNYFDNAKTSLLYLLGCGTAPLVASLTSVDAIFSYGANCSNAQIDLQGLLFDLMGSSGDRYRSTESAYEHRLDDAAPWGMSVVYQHSGGPVLLSPAVTHVSPDVGAFVEPGKSTTILIEFDTQMSPSQPAMVDGCGASIDGDQTWNGDHTLLTFELAIPQRPPDNKMEIRVKNDVATANADVGWANLLSGNASGVNGEYPNGNDYHWDMTCEQALDLRVDGQFGGKPVSGQIVGTPSPRLSCDQLTSGDKWVGNIVHWNGLAETTQTPVAGEFDIPFGTYTVGTDIGDQNFTLDLGPPYTHLGGVSGTITQNQDGGSIDATAAYGGGPGDSIHVSGTWTCPSGGSPAP